MRLSYIVSFRISSLLAALAIHRICNQLSDCDISNISAYTLAMDRLVISLVRSLSAKISRKFQCMYVRFASSFATFLPMQVKVVFIASSVVISDVWQVLAKP